MTKGFHFVKFFSTNFFLRTFEWVHVKLFKSQFEKSYKQNDTNKNEVVLFGFPLIIECRTKIVTYLHIGAAKRLSISKITSAFSKMSKPSKYFVFTLKSHLEKKTRKKNYKKDVDGI